MSEQRPEDDMNDEHEPKQENENEKPAPARPPRDVLGTWLESQRLTEQMLNPPILWLLEQPSWLKAGPAAMSSDITRAFSAGHLDFTRGVLADYERTRRLLGGFNPVFDTAREVRALSAAGAFPALHEAMVAHQSITRLIEPFDFAVLTRDLAGVSDAVASIEPCCVRANTVRTPI